MQNRFMDLTELANKFATDKGSLDGDRHLYTEIYATLFESFRLLEFSLLELGLLRSPNPIEERDPFNRFVERIPSMEMWLSFFPNAICYGFDQADFSAFKMPRFHFMRGDLSVDKDIERLAAWVHRPRIIIDDASHASFHQQRAFMRLFPVLAPGGFYAVEDLHYSPPFADSFPSCRAFAEIVQQFLDEGILTLDFASAEEARRLGEEIGNVFVHCSDRGRPDWGPKLVIFQKRAETKSLRLLPSSFEAAESQPLSPAWLSSRLFSFRTGPEKGLMTSSMRFEMNGRISGYGHPNEAAWRIEHDKLVILNNDGVPSCITSPIRNSNGTTSFRGSFLLGQVDVDHWFEENPSEEGLPEVFSFDVFDTLVARRCYDPLEIFSIIERKSGFQGFRQLRQAEESKLWNAGDYNLTDIYEKLGTATGWSIQTLETLRMLELAEEWDNIFPIAEIVARVGPDDLIISDMYLPMDFLQRILTEKCGLDNRLIHLSSHGKHRGGIWPKVAATHRIRCHHGDNLHSDVESAGRAGLAAQHVTVSAWSRGEQILGDTGLSPLARTLREARLASFDRDPRLRGVQLAQLNANMPLLILAGLAILQRARDRNVDTLLMCSRDCNLWFPLLRWMAALSSAAPMIRYIVSSRPLFLSERLEYRAYFLGMRGHRNMLIDLSGTGQSPSRFLTRNGDQANTSIFLATATDCISNLGDTVTPTDGDVGLEVFTQQPHDVRFMLEALNMSADGRAHSMMFTGHNLEVAREPSEFSAPSQSIIATMRTSFMNALVALQNSDTYKLPENIPVGTLRLAAVEIIGLLHEYRGFISPVYDDILRVEPTFQAAI